MDINKSLALYDEIEKQHAHKASINGIQMGWLDFGSKNDIPLIWAHGSCLTCYEILNVQKGLAAAGYRVIAIDYRGHGKTQLEISANNTSLYHIADDIADLMNYLGIKKAVVGGLSKGGWVATAFYDSYPESVLGLLLEDGGSYSNIQLNDEIRAGVVHPASSPLHADAVTTLYTPSSRFQTLEEAVDLAFTVFSSAIRNHHTTEFVTFLVSLFIKTEDSLWRFHCRPEKLMRHESLMLLNEKEPTPYSLLPIMQMSQELMLPLVIYRNLHVPVHIIDPVSPETEFPVSHQNSILAEMHPELVTHEIYGYEYSPHGAHFERPERFIESAEKLLHRVKGSEI